MDKSFTLVLVEAKTGEIRAIIGKNEAYLGNIGVMFDYVRNSKVIQGVYLFGKIDRTCAYVSLC